MIPSEERRLPPLLVIAGATATGKTGLSLAIADRLFSEGHRAEVVSADSRQVYRGLDVGTAKVAADDRARIRHHGLDLAEPDEPFSVAHYVAAASSALAGIAERHAIAILVGGTGLYLRALARGLPTDELPADAGVRASIEVQIVERGLPAAAAHLARLAPLAAARIDLRNPRRVARALEVAILGGDRPPPQPRGYAGPSSWIGLRVAADVHRRWIASRATAQFASGLIAEAAALRERFDPSLRAFSAIGYREAWAVLDGALSIEQAIELDRVRNVAFAARQRTWFRAEPGVTWLDAEDTAAAVATGLAVAHGLLDGWDGTDGSVEPNVRPPRGSPQG